MKAVGMALATRNPGGSLSPVAIQADRLMFRKFLTRALEKGEAFVLEMRTIRKPRTFKQMGTVWGLNKILFQCLNDGRSPSEDEAYETYLDVLETYGDRVEVKMARSKLASNGPPKTRVIHLSEADTVAASKIIQGYIELLAAFDLTPDQQGGVKKIFFDWMAWRGSLSTDPLDAVAMTGKASKTEAAFRERNTLCMACTRGEEGLQLAHIVGRGANGRVKSEPWNWLILCHKCHTGLQHQKG